jgi:peptide/nickel transport system permease protein
LSDQKLAMSDTGAESSPAPEAAPSLAAPVAEPLPAITPIQPPRKFKLPPFAIVAAWRFGEVVATMLIAAILLYFVLELAPRTGDMLQGDVFMWLTGMLTGYFGLSDSQGFAIGPVLAERLSVTVPLVILSFVPAVAIGIGLGLVAGRQPNGIADKLLSGLAAFGTAFAAPWLAMLLVLLLASTLKLIPPGGFIPWSNPLGAIASLFMPALTLILPLSSAFAIATGGALAAAQAAPMMQTARTLGYTPREAIRTHAVPNALATMAASLSLQAALLVPASVIVENVFYLPGLGRLIFTALAERDVTTLRAGLFTLVLLIALARFGADMLRAWLDPKSRVTP